MSARRGSEPDKLRAEWMPDGRHHPQIVTRLLPGSHRHDRTVAILIRLRWRRPMRAYVTAAGMALGLIAIWAALVQFVA